MKCFWVIFIAIGIGEAKSQINHSDTSEIRLNDFTYIEQLSESKLESGFQCPPCGCINDTAVYSGSGLCSACGMQLVRKKEGIAREIDNIIKPIFAGSALGRVYTKLIYPLYAVGVLVSLLFIFTSSRGRSLNIFLSGTILILALYGFKNQLYGVKHGMAASYESLFAPISFILLVGPLIYLYVKSLTVNSFKWIPQYWIHFAPAGIAFFFYTILFFMNDSVKDLFMSSSYEISFSHFEQIVAVLLGFGYLIASGKLLSSVNSDLVGKTTMMRAWLTRFLIGMGLLLLIWGLVIFLNYWLYDFGVATVNYNPLWVLIGIVLMWIAVEIIYNLKFFLIAKQFGFSPNNSLSDAELHRYRFDLENLMTERKLYTNPNISLEILANHLKINPRYLSMVLNTAIGKNFYDFINQYRIDEAKHLLVDPQNQNITIEAISFEAGFKSKSSFNAAFKKYTKMTPKEYVEQFRTLERASS